MVRGCTYMHKPYLTTIHTLPKHLLGEILEVYIYRNEGLDAIIADVWSVVKDTPERLLHYASYKEELKDLCVEAGLSYKNVHKEFLLLVNWLHLTTKDYTSSGWNIIDIVVSENLDVICYFQHQTCREAVDHRVRAFRYHLPFQSLTSPAPG